MANNTFLLTRRHFLHAAAATVAARAFAQTSAPAKLLIDQPFTLGPTLRGDFTLASVGDLIATHPVRATIARTSPDLLKTLADADVTFGNCEETMIDLNNFDGYPEALSGGTWIYGTPDVADDLKAMGFDIVSRANNHATDWGVRGMQATDRLLDKAGLVHAGTGPNLSAARAPGYLDSAKGRVALVAASAHYTDMEPAQDALGRIPARPGINPLHLELSARVPPDRFEEIEAIAAMQPQGLKKKQTSPDAVTLLGTKYEKGEAGQKEIGLHYVPNKADRDAILLGVRQAKEVSDFAMLSLHIHEPGNWSEAPADFLPEFARAAIDAGADAFLGHGPHQLRGIEIYKGRPIFYSLGNFCFMENSLEPLTPQEYTAHKATFDGITPAELVQKRMVSEFSDPALFESAVAVSHYRDGVLAEVRLYPIDLSVTGPNGTRGIPRLAGNDVAQRVLARLQRLSDPYKTRIELQGNVGIIKA